VNPFGFSIACAENGSGSLLLGQHRGERRRIEGERGEAWRHVAVGALVAAFAKSCRCSGGEAANQPPASSGS
jgi:hypothetical protein